MAKHARSKTISRDEVLPLKARVEDLQEAGVVRPAVWAGMVRKMELCEPSFLTVVAQNLRVCMSVSVCGCVGARLCVCV